MDEVTQMQDSGPALGRLLADFLHIGVVVVDDAGNCRFANTHACDLLDAADEAVARLRWAAMRVRIDARTRDAAPVAWTLDVTTARGVRRLRAETHALRGAGGCAVLLRDCGTLGEADRLPILAARAETSRAVLAGLVHGASGPLNNFRLTLAVLDASLAQFDNVPEAAAACARMRRHLGVLRSEAATLVSRLDEMRVLAERRPCDPARIDLAQSVRDIARWLRHEAVVREAAIEAEASSPAWVVADRDAMTLALVALSSRLLDGCGAGGALRLSASQVEDEGRCIVRIAVDPASVSAAFADALFAIRPMPHDPAPATARMIVEASGGTLAFHCDTQQCAVVATLPAA